MKTTQQPTRTPGDLFGWGVVVALAGLMFTGLAAAVTGTPELMWVAVLPGVIGGVLMQIGVIAWGVAIGVRTATADRR